ncbi:MAG: TetR/AcrR family transcriptional regulator [Planctomycetes bacterium]|nr:TetR/AcrR family transcriptional regulator [Planctomycetota bacterium]
MRTVTAKREARQKQLLQAALRVFARNGFDGASVADIAEAAGVAKGSVYLYFDSKESLAGDLVTHLFTYPAEGARPSQEMRPLHRILDFCAEQERRVLELGTQAPVVLHMFGHVGKTEDDQLARGVRQLIAESRFLVRLLLANAQKRGSLPSGVDLRHAAAMILAVSYGMIHGRLANGAARQPEQLDSREAVAVFLRGLGADLGKEA